MTQARRSRGRPPAGDGHDRRTALVETARRQFAAKGFAGASLRSIAAEAGVDPSLVNHYFGDKQGLLVATLELPIDPLAKIRSALAGGTDGLGERLVRTFLSSWDPHREVFATMARTGLGSADPAAAPVAEVARAVLVGSLLEVLEGPDAELRAALVGSQVVGLGLLRYVAVVEPLASAGVEEVVALVGPALQRLVDG